MLLDINRFVRGKFAAFIIGIICLVFILWGADQTRSSTTQRNVAKVNGIEIPYSQYQQQLQFFLEQQSLPAGIDTGFIESLLRPQIIERMVAEQINSQYSQALGLKVTSSEFLSQVKEIPEFQEDGVFSEELYRNFIRNNPQISSRFSKQLQSSLLEQQLPRAMQISASPSRLESRYYELFNAQERSFAYVQFNSKDFSNSTSIADSELEAYYEENKNSFATPEQYQIEYVELTADLMTNSSVATIAEQKQYYQEHQYDYRIPKAWRLAHILLDNTNEALSDAILTSARQGNKSFAALAKLHSVDTSTLDKGGELGWFVQDALPSFLELDPSTLEPGVILGPLKSQYGMHLVTVLESSNERVNDFNAVQDSIINTLTELKTREQLSIYKEQLENLAYQYADSLKEVASEMNLPLNKTDYVSLDNLPQSLQVPQISQILSSEEVAELDMNSPVIEAAPGRYIALRIAGKKPQQLEAFSQVRERIVNILMTQRAQDAMVQHITDLAAQINAENLSYDASIKALNVDEVRIKHVSNINRHDPSIQPEILESVFSLYLEDSNAASAGVVALDKDKQTMVILKSIHLPSRKDIFARNPEYLQQLKAMQVQQELSYIQQSLRDSAVVEYF